MKRSYTKIVVGSNFLYWPSLILAAIFGFVCSTLNFELSLHLDLKHSLLGFDDCSSRYSTDRLF